MQKTWMSINRCTDKEDVAHIYNGMLFSHKKEQNTAICSNMEATRDYHTKWKHLRKRKTNATWQYFYVDSEIWHKWTHLWNITDPQTERTLWFRRSGRRGIADANYHIWEGYTGSYRTALHGDYIQSPVIDYNAEEHKRECVHIRTHTHIHVHI